MQLTQYRVDSKVIQLFIIIGVIGVGILSYQFYSYTPSTDVRFMVLGDRHKVNEMIKFENKTYGKHQFIWNFGDSSKISVRRSPVHVYDKPGRYQVSLLVDNQFEKTLLLEIEKEYKAAPEIVMPKIVGPKTVVVGKKFKLTCPTENVKSYAWYIEGRKTPVGYHKQLSYSFKKPGYKNVTLVVNGETRYSAKMSINVKQQKNTKAKEIAQEIEEDSVEEVFVADAPDLYSRIDELEQQEEKAWILPTDSELQVKLINDLSENGNEKDFIKYLNEGADYKMVFANQNYITFNELVKELKGRDIVVKEFSTLRNDNRITKLTIRYRIKRR